ncbi:hypothetical protein [Lactiplantibacillus plantarum]|uniref:hypothetical protein n=1 Tax=Lactiplantibacillus plantarum TaxID=1590 RepID=UPI001BAAC06D|nr:hypothetical protein [Lactiplantibacillus plantarum]MBS0938017.1 hypothetical protein [Lactiplantibacillus plantarum]MBS0945515.1 hypothetical protein [Lactiplantibacillus plantarum]
MAANLIKIEPLSGTWAGDMDKNLAALNADTGWLPVTLFAPVNGRLFYRATPNGVTLRGFVTPVSFSNVQPVKIASIPMNTVLTPSGDDRAFILAQGPSNYAVSTLSQTGELWLVSISGDNSIPVHFDGVTIN